MEVLIVYKEDYPWDVRVEKLALTLKSDGHNVTIIARNRDQLPTIDESDQIAIRRLPITRRVPKFIQVAVNLPFWFNPFWLWLLFKSSRGIKGNRGVIIVRDLPLVKAGIIVAKFRKSKMVFDMAECYPEMYESAAKFSNRSLTTKILKSPWFAKQYERNVVAKADHILVMIQESKDRLISMGVDEEKISIVSNTPPIDKFRGAMHEHSGNQLRIVYVGFLSKLRGLDLLIEGAAQYIKTQASSDAIRIDIVGKGAQKEHLIALTNELGISESVKIHGWLDQEEVDELMSLANVGALTYRVCGHWNHTIPNKIFDYMLAGLPVLATEVIPIARILRETDSGLVCKDLDPIDIAKKMALLRDPQRRTILGKNGQAAIKLKYNWDNDAKALTAAINAP
ncbi:glycosyltransferase family 4 protein [Marinobacter sp. 71-i]|uniref:Glycosyltransferase family 4 protein n=1 Tax=Marinobacter iranensis TaxID=2962607 RepID=A0ABT5YEN9_9GAMM|nr:glycosyltransferase family 4 protein [Marinobacter iranensis]MDF0752165.1 glycosyltransferase family 4 protein [Marinobacter iranensis]